MNIRYRVTLSPCERDELRTLLGGGRELRWKVGDGADQAADLAWLAISIPFANCTPVTIFVN
jgi:hypothetical protein